MKRSAGCALCTRPRNRTSRPRHPAVSRDLVRLAEERGLAVLADDPMQFAVTTADGASVSLRPARRAGLVLERTAPDAGILATTDHLWTAELLVAR